MVSWSRTRAFHHYTVGGELVVEEQQILDHAVEEVACRWCASSRAVVVVDAVDVSVDGIDQTVGDLDDLDESESTAAGRQG